MKKLIVLLIGLLFISACGQKGPLYFPEHDDQAAENTTSSSSY